jgi:xanthine dehydrogenase YagT iron-sulfur-binding subunit
MVAIGRALMMRAAVPGASNTTVTARRWVATEALLIAGAFEQLSEQSNTESPPQALRGPVDRYVSTKMEHDMQTPGDLEISRRDLMIGAAASVAVTAAPSAAAAPAPVGETPVTPKVSFNVNGQARELAIDIRTTLLDALRERLQLTGTKKGCDHGQCGACTVIVDGRRINSCLTLAVMHEGASITTIEGLGTREDLHPMQAAFVKHDGYQCGYCTPGQICSAVAVLDEIKDGVPSLVSTDLTAQPQLTAAELRERMSGNICRCGAYSNIVDAITEVAGRKA